MSAKKFTLVVLSLLGMVLAGIIGIVVLVDPLFHYHAPLPFLQYRIDNAMYQNNGILRHFDYNAVIIGTSMSQNFNTSQADELFGYDFVKTPLAGANYIETNEVLSAAFKHNDHVECVIRNIDYSWMADTENTRYYEGILPEYLYDDNILNDVSYWFSRDVLLRIVKDVFLFTLQGNTTTSFDVYQNWSDQFILGADAFLTVESRAEISTDTKTLSDEEKAIISQHAYENFVQVAIDNPDTTFYMFYAPYSVAYWDKLDRIGETDLILDAKILVTEEIFKADNIKLFSFDTNRELVSNLDYYRDHAHHGQETSNQILDWIAEGAYEMTPENYLDIIASDRKFYKNFDYDALYEGLAQ